MGRYGLLSASAAASTAVFPPAEAVSVPAAACVAGLGAAAVQITDDTWDTVGYKVCMWKANKRYNKCMERWLGGNGTSSGGGGGVGSGGWGTRGLGITGLPAM